jgi:hypothetical protein
MHNAEDIWLELSRPLPSFADLVRSYAPLVRGYPAFDPDEPRGSRPYASRVIDVA